MPLERFSAAWREGYVSGDDVVANAREDVACVFCVLAAQPVDESTGVLWRGSHTFVVLNAFPYGSGHVLVLPLRHVAGLVELRDEEYLEFSLTIRRTARALDGAYGAEGMNVGMNLGVAAGAGIPKHLHAHVLPRWNGDTNFMTTIGEVRVLPESLASTWNKVRPYLETEA
ncbi:MAG: HIT family protein [Acidimicrobiales bacterium]